MVFLGTKRTLIHMFEAVGEWERRQLSYKSAHQLYIADRLRPLLIKDGDATSQDREQVSTSIAGHPPWLMTIQASTWTVRNFTSIWDHTADFRQHTEITLQDVPNLKYKLELFIGSEEIELQRKDSQTWTPARCPYALRFLTT